jgi:benzoate membrane transport protein
MSLFGLGAAFWGLLFGLAAHALLRWKLSRRNSAELHAPVGTKN